MPKVMLQRASTSWPETHDEMSVNHKTVVMLAAIWPPDVEPFVVVLASRAEPNPAEPRLSRAASHYNEPHMALWCCREMAAQRQTQ
jgi:hypothetical protein